MFYKVFFGKITLWALAFFGLLAGIFVYATIDRTEIISEQLIVIPDTVTSENWVGGEKIQEQDISEDSLYQDFSPLNSAFIDVDAVTVKPELLPTESDLNSTESSVENLVPNTQENASEVNLENSNDSSVGQSTSEETAPSNESSTLQEVQTEVVPDASKEESPSEPIQEQVPPPESSDSPTSYNSSKDISWGIFTLADQKFPLLQEVITSDVSTTESLTGEAEASVLDDVYDESVEDFQTDGVETDVITEDVDVTEENSVNELDIVGDSIETDGVTEIVKEDDFIQTPEASEACAGDSECKMYGVTFSGFEMPEFETGKFITSAQLRLSLAARTLSHNDTDPQRFIVEYTYSGVDTWQTATVIDINDEISNSINGSYFLVSLDKPLHQNDLSNLQVRISYQGNINNLQRAYIESAWLEMVSSSFYEKVGSEIESNQIDYNRDLLEPKFHELNNSDLDSAMSKLPSFTLSYSPQQNFLKRVFNYIFSENIYKVETVSVIDQNNAVVTVPIDYVYQDDKTWTLKFLEQPQKLVPGKYKIEVVVNENDNFYTDTFEFYWGVLAVNTTKSMYFPNEKVDLNLAALTDKGDTICDANLQLKIIDPENNIYEIPVEQSGSCGKNNVTDVPDYLASLDKTDKVGIYTVQLQHLNRNGEVVHKINDSFEVREYIPYNIERIAPTRIYPVSPYEVKLKIKANRVFTGDIIERVPRGFVLDDTDGADVITEPDYTELVWHNIKMDEGDEIELHYRFDAPDISPYMYLLGPLNMDGFKELRQWQIASDALTSIGLFTGTRAVAGTNLNGTPSPLQWSTSTVDNYYFTHSTSSNSHQVTLKQSGDYMLSVTLPQHRTDGNSSRTRIGVQVKVNGVSVPQGLGRSAYIRGFSSHTESSSQTSFLLKDISINDYVEVYTEGLTTIDAGDIVNVTGQAQLLLEYISTSRDVFSATSTQTTNSTNLNQTTSYPLKWVETRQDSGFTHSDSTNPENIIIASAGTYLVTVNVPLTGDTAQQSVLGRVKLDGVQVTGGIFAQGYVQVGTESDDDSSIHWSGFVVATTTNQVLTITTEREAGAGTSTVTTGFVGSIFMEKLPTTDLIALSGTRLVSGTDWNPAATSSIQWTTRNNYDSSIYTHSTSTNSHQITVLEAGSYELVYNDAMTSAIQRANNRIQVQVNGTSVSGAQTKSHYLRNQSAHNNSSASLVYMLNNLSVNDVITVTSVIEANNGTVNSTTSATLLLWQKTQLNERPASPTLYDKPFNNIRFASTTPYFDFSATDPDGTSDIKYQFSISTTSGFTASTTKVSGTDAGFFNTASSTDTSPFIEGNKARFQLQSANVLIDLQTYYWRVRAMDATGSGEYGDWSTTQSLTVDMSASAPNWYQTYSDQFDGDSLVGTVSNASDKVQVDATRASEILLVYGEGTVTTPRYRLWNGSVWGVEGSAQAVTNTINWVKTASGVTRNEYALVTLDQSNDAYAQIYMSSTTSWGNTKLLSSVVASNAYRGVAVAYESLSGDAMAVSCTNGPDPVYSIWNGTSWSATSSINASSVNNCNFLEIASDPASDEIILVVRDTGTQYEALVWNGSLWVDSRVIGSSALVASEGMSVVYESSGDQAIVSVSNNTANNIAYTVWDGTAFSPNTTQTIGNDFLFGKLEADPESDEIALCYIDASSDIGILQWDGGAWNTFQEIELTGNTSTARPIECNYETMAGRSDYLLATYSDTTDSRYQSATSTVWSTEATLSTISDSFWVQSERADDGTIVAVNLDDASDFLDTSYWNGTSWSAKSTLETSPSSVIAAPYEMYDMTAKHFQFSEGVVTTPVIDFDWVPNQPTWGDITFSTTEPFGTDVKVSVLYSSSTTCDTIVPDGVLSGNSTGFDVGNVPIDLTSLSTSTYNQICMEATVTTQGSASASLDDWTLSWVREPKLVQNNYRWYVNGSFITPTDVWPSGVSDVAENTALSSVTAINNNANIRLRMSLAGANVALPAFTEAFKLQYAEGLNCSPSLTWREVGSPASTTALWRGYENSIAGSDWLGSGWGKRVKITVNNNVVDDDVTNFPTYVDLADLPTTFFQNVKSDGGDIRVTQSNGLTEVPFELVAINTGSETGELHFKSTLSSTTNTEYFIYYDNPSASGYAVSATYGARNVWTNGYSLRYQMGNNPAGSSPQFRDSTSNGNNAVARSGMTSGDVVTGKIGSAIDLDGNDGGVFQSALAYGGEFTASMWWYSSSTGYAIAGPSGANEKMGPWSSPVGKLFVRAVSSSDTGVNYPAHSQWNHVVLTRDSSNKIDVHINGTTTRLFADVAQSGTSDWQNFGGDTTEGFVGKVDELRFSNTRRTNGWISTEFNNQSNPTGFYAVSAEELIGDGLSLTSTLLTGSDNYETYEEVNPTETNQNTLAVGNDSEWDFSLQNNGAISGTNYCFRMVYEDGSVFNSYTNYPRLITNAPPIAPELYTPFDNEKLASTTPWFDFASTDELGDNVAYQIQVSTDVNFASTVIDNDSVTNFTLFTNTLDVDEKSEFTSGQRIQYIPTTSLINGNTYWWRVRGQDISGSGIYGDWSTFQSFTVATTTVISTWFQTTGDQFATNVLQDSVVSTSTNDIGIETSFTAGTTTSSVIDFADGTIGNAWGALSFTHNVTSGTIRYYVEYRVSGDTFALIPDSVLPSNSTGFTSSPVSLSTVNPVTYSELRIRSVFSGNSTLPRLQDWTVTWDRTIEVPTLLQYFDNAKIATTTPTFTFYTTDPENDDIQYELQISSSYAFTSSSTYTSGVNAGFTNTASTTDTSPFVSGNTISYTAQSALTNGNTYWWRVRAKDLNGDNTWSDYSSQRSFTIDNTINVSMWHQTTGEQFVTDTLVDIETTAGTAKITSVISEVLMAYGEGTNQAPRYRKWNGNSWSVAGSGESVGAQIRWTDLGASPTRPEYALATVGTDADMNVQIYNTNTNVWSNVNELETNIPDTLQRGFDVSYETNSGDLLAVSCSGNDAVYSVWNGTSWTATSSLTLANTNNCLYIELASDPTSDEIVAVFKHTNTSATDYELKVWNGSSWGNSLTLANMNENANAGAAVVYEESGGQAIVALTNDLATTLLYALWNGSAWSTSTQALGDHIEWASLKRDVGTDEVVLCYMDNDINIGVLKWTGSAWGTFNEIEQTGNAKAGHAVDCNFETTSGRDGYTMAMYSDTTNARYQTAATTTFGGELTLDTIQDSWRVLSVRGGNGTIHSMFFDDTNDRYDTSRWAGSSWTALETISSNPSIAGTPFDGSLAMAARIYPDFISGSIRSTPIDFSDGSGPRWEAVTWNNTTPGTSYIKYRLYYLASTSVYTLVPDSALVGNSTGFTTSPIDLSELDRTIYDTLKLDAQFTCLAGDCPTLNDWSVAWSEGITVAGTAYEYDASTTIATGTVAVAVNGVIQSGKTSVISGGGVWSIPNVTMFANDIITVFVDGATSTDEAIGITKYDGVGNISGMQLAKRNLTIGSGDSPIIHNSDINYYDNSNDEDLFYIVDGSNVLNLCNESTCTDAKLRVLSGSTYQPNTDGSVINFENYGTFAPATSTMRVSGNWTQNGTFTVSASTIIFTATTSSLTLQSSTSSLAFNNVTFGETSGSTTWTPNKTISADGSIVINYGTLARGTSTINVGGNLQIGASGYMSGLATTTFNGSGSYTWSDAKSSTTSTNIGYAVIDGTAKTITLGGNVAAGSITIGIDDTFNASGSGYNVNVYGSWTNNNSFIPQSGTVTFVGTSSATINRGGSSFNNLTFSGAGGSWSFSTSTLTLNGNLTIATGTVTLPTGTTTIAGSFLNTGGTFAHNNGEVRMTSTSVGKSITQNGTAFLNPFYDLVFTGSGSWSFTDTNATTSHNLRMQSGTVTFPSGTLTVGADLSITATGIFTHNSGEVILLLENANEVRANGSSFNNLKVYGVLSTSTRTFTDTNVTILGNLNLIGTGTTVLPTGTLSIGGSLINTALFTSNNGTVRFNSTAGSETINAGNSAFASLDFNSATGDFTVTENATATGAINLTNAQQFILSSGKILTAQSSFTNAVVNANTTWTGSTLRLVNSGTITLNAKTHAGDTYGTLESASSTLTKMWNSSANSYVTSGATGTIYSQDHAGVDGDLNIYGNYTRNTGTEYWNVATDFDGVALTGINRQVDVKVASSSNISLIGASLSMIGTSTASTTISAISGTYTITASNSTLNNQYFTLSGTGIDGLNLTASTTLTTFSDGYLDIAPSYTGIKVDASTIDTNPAKQLFRIGFATTTTGAAGNVTLTGSPSSFIWFRTGFGNLYGEAFDSGDANPGSIRFDDSAFLVTVLGTVYSDDGTTPMSVLTCNGVTPNVRLVVDGGTYASSTSCNAVTGAYSFSNVAYVGDPRVIVYLDTNGGEKGSVVTKTLTGNVINMNIYANRVIVRHEDVTALSVVDMTYYDNSNDSDISFEAVDSVPDTLTTFANTELYVNASSTFAPNGNITLGGNGNSNSYEGTLALATSSSFVAQGTESHTLAGRLVVGTNATFTTASSTFIFNATTTGRSITSSATTTFNNLVFAGTAGGWNITSNLNILGNMSVSSGTVTGTGNIILSNGSLSGNGILSMGSGAVKLDRSNTLGGITAWTFNNLVLGNGSVIGTTTPSGTATTTILGTLTISNAHFLDANNSNWDLAGVGTVFTETGTLLEDTSTIRFSGAGANVPSTNYYNLTLNAGAGSPTYTGVGSGILVLNDLTIGGSANSAFTVNTTDQTLEVRGDVSIFSNGTLEASNSANLTVLSDWTNAGTFTNNSGTLRFTGTGTSNINAGNSAFSTVLINGTGNFNVTNNATATTAWTLQNHNNFTLSSGQVLAVGGQFTNGLGGANTTWTGSTLSLYGNSTYSINSSTSSDSYENLKIGFGTQIRMWNSSASAYDVSNTGSLYSQDHSSVNGDLYIWGQLSRTTGSDYWSYATDFDGTSLTGSERVANVYFASGASAIWAGSSLSAVGSTSASTTIQNQGSGTYGLTLGSSASTTWSRVQIRDTNSSGIVFAGTPTVNDFSYTDHLVAINSATAMTVGGTVINQNPAKNFTSNKFEAGGGVTGAVNVTATGTSISSWRFTNHIGNISGEGFDSDPDGDPGYVVWDDSAALLTVSGVVYSDEGPTLSGVCDGVTSNIRLVVAGLTTYDTTCSATSSAYSIGGVAFSPADTLTLYINGETEKAVNVTVSPISSISNMNLYENRVIARHENTNPLTIADMAVWDSSDDADISFTAVNAGTDTLTLPANTKLLVWTGKTFEPNGNVTLSGGGAGGVQDGTLEVQTNGQFTAKTSESHSVGGSIIFNTNAVFVSASSTVTLTTTGVSRTVDVNANNFHNLTFSGAGSWNITDPTLTVNGSYSQSNGVVTFPTGTTTVRSAFNVTSGSFNINNSPLILASTAGGTTVHFNGSSVGNITFSGSGGTFNMTDTNATATGAVRITAGTVSLPSGTFTVGSDFENTGGTITHNTSDLIMTATTTAVLHASSSDLYLVNFAGSGSFTITDPSITFLSSFNVNGGAVTVGTGTTAIGGSLLVNSGSFVHSSGTVLLNATSSGHTINAGNNNFYNLQIGAPTGGYTLQSATTTNNFTIANASSLTVQSGATITVGGVFTNSVGGASTTWTSTTLNLNSASSYSLNSRTNNGDIYGTLALRQDADVRMWYSSAATTTVATSSSLYSQDHNNVNGSLNIYGDFGISTTTEYWNYATDFDGTSLFGVERIVNVYMATSATTTINSGTLQILGGSGNTTNIQGQGSGTYSFQVLGGTFNANNYTFAGLDINGLQLSNTTSITNLSDGYFDLKVDTGSLITLSSTTLNVNPSLIFDNVGFHATSGISGYNVNLVGDTSNAWRFTNNYGNIGGEGFDIDGVDDCGSIRFADSSCLITEQTHYRWRADDGTEGGPTSEWLADSSFDLRKRIRVQNNDNQTYASTSVKVTIAYDSDMKSDFSDLRFTAGDGVIQVPFWVEKYTASTDAIVWVLVPSLPASGQSVIQMYYGSTTASSVSDGSTVFNLFDSFEDNNIFEYSGDSTLFNTSASLVYGGSYGLKPTNVNGKTTDGIFRFDQTVSQGEIIRYMQYVNTSGTSDEPCTLFGVQSPGTTNLNYAVCLELFGTDRLSLAKDVQNNDISGTVLATTTVSYSTGWYEVEVDWQTNDDIDVSLYNSAGTLVATTTANNSAYTSGGYGYAFWGQNGAWDSMTSRPRATTKPTTYIGAEQGPNGATWLANLDTAASSQIGENVRLRVAIENSGLAITNQQFTVEYATKGVALSCGSVSSASYATVPNIASCGSSPVCMATSTNISDDSNSSDLLTDTNGEFVAGKIVTSPSSETTSMTVAQNYYTELEYLLATTNNANDSYCFRVTNAGTPLDFYGEVAELSLRFNPVFGTVSLNQGQDISLTPGTTTAVYATGTVTDLNGYTDLLNATATIYRSGAGASCTPDTNNCYVLNTASSSCSFTNCSGNSCTLSCLANIQFHADATDADTYEGQEWLAYMEAEDQSTGYDFASAPGIELLTMRALSVDSLISYGSLTVDSNTGSYNPTTTVTNLGNTPINVDVEATDLSDGASSYIPANQQKVATSTFTYTACVSCFALSSSSPVTLGLNLTKPSVETPPVETDVYWGIAVPFTASNAAHTGVNLFTAIGL